MDRFLLSSLCLKDREMVRAVNVSLFPDGITFKKEKERGGKKKKKKVIVPSLCRFQEKRRN